MSLRSSLSILLGLCAATFASAPLVASAAVLDVETDADTWIESANPTTNYGSDNQLSVETDAAFSRALFHFTLPTIPVTDRISSAILKLTVQTPDLTGTSVRIYPCSVLFNASAESGATWNTHAAHDSTDLLGIFAPTASGEIAIDFTSVVKQWKSGARTNNGIMLVADPGGMLSTYRSKEHGNSSFHPQIEITTQPIIMGILDLELTMTAPSLIADEGDTVSFDFTVSNLGPTGGATSVEVTDVLPASLAFVSASPSHGTYTNSTGIWDIGGVPTSTPRTMTLQAEVQAGTGGTNIVNSASITNVDQSDSNGGNNSDNVTIDVQDADISVLQSVSADTTDVGSNVTFTIQCKNAGPDASEALEVTTNLSTGLVYVSDVPEAGTYNSGTGVWAVPSIAAGDSLELALTLSPIASRAGTQQSTFAFVSLNDRADTNSGNESDSAHTYVPGADVEVTASMDQASAPIGDSVSYEVFVENKGPDEVTGLFLGSVLDAGLTLDGDAATQGTYNSGTGVWDVGSLANGSNATLTLDLTIDAGTAGDSLSGSSNITSAAVGDPQSGNDSSSGTVYVPDADLAVTQTVASDTTAVGASTTFTVRAINSGPDAASSVAVTNVQSAGLLYLSDVPEIGTYNSGTGLWSIPSIAASDTVELTITVLADSAAFGTNQFNYATINAFQDDSNGTNDSDSTFTYVPGADLQMQAALDLARAAAADTVTFTVALQNVGPDATSGVTVGTAFDAGFNYLSHSATTGTYNSGTGTWNFGGANVASDDTLTVLLSVLATSYGSTLNASANVTATNTYDPTAASSADSVYVEDADLSITQIVSADTTTIGSNVTFTVRAINAGPDSADAVEVTNQRSSGLSFVSDLPAVGSFDSGSGVWSIPSIAPGDTAEIAITATPDTSFAGSSQSHYAFVSGVLQGDSNPGGEDDSSFTYVPGADYQMDAAFVASSTAEGDTVSFVVALANLGPDPTTSLAAATTFDAGLTYVTHTVTRGTYNSGTGAWNLGAVPAASDDSLAIDVILGPGTSGTVLNASATVTGAATADPTPANASDADSLSVEDADLSLIQLVSADTTAAGNNVTFTVKTINAGPDSADAVEVTNQASAGLSYVSDVAGVGTYDSGSGLWSIPTIAPGDTAEIAITVVPDTSFAGSLQSHFAFVSDVLQGDSNPGGESDSAFTYVPGADVSLTAVLVSGSKAEGDTVSFVVAVTNAGPDPIASLTTTTTLDAGLQYAGHSATSGSYNSVTGDWTLTGVGTTSDDSLFVDLVLGVGTSGTTLNAAAAVTSTATIDPTPANTAQADSLVVESADLTITQLVTPDTTNVGSNVTFTVRAVNAGPDSADVVEITNTQSTGLSFVSDLPTVGSYNSGTGVWSIPTIAPGDTAEVAITATPDSSIVGSQASNFAIVSSVVQGDTNPGGESDSAFVYVPGADFAVATSMSLATAAEGDTVTFQVVAQNLGPNDTGSLTLSQLYAAGLTYAGHATTSGAYDSGGGTWVLAPFANGSNDTLTVDLVIGPGVAGGAVQASSSVTTSTVTDATLGNNADSSSVYVPSVDLVVATTVSPDPPYASGSAQLDVILTNAGTDTTFTTIVDDLLPAELSFTGSGQTQGSYDDGAGQWTVGALAPGDSALLSIFVTVDAGAADSTITNTATATSPGATDANPADNSASSIFVVKPLPSVSILEVTTPATATVGQTGLPATLRVRNFSADSVAVDSLDLRFLGIPDDLIPDFVVSPDPSSPAKIRPDDVDTVSVIVDVAGDAPTGVRTVEGEFFGVDDFYSLAVSDTTSDVLGSIEVQAGAALSGVPGTLTPTTILTGTALASSIDVTNSGGVAVTYSTATRLRIAGASDTLDLPLGGPVAHGTSSTITLALDSTPVPRAFPTGTHATILELVGTDGNGAPFSQATVLTDSVIVVDEGVGVAAWDPGTGVAPGFPGGANEYLASFSITSMMDRPLVLNQLQFDNTAIGDGSATEMDASFGKVTLYHDDGDGNFSAASDSLLDVEEFVSGGLDFSSLGVAFPASSVQVFHLAASVATSARDSDTLSVSIRNATSVGFDEGSVTFFAEFPVESATSLVVEGMTDAQIVTRALPVDYAETGESAWALAVRLPGNGYEADTLTALRVENLGSATDSDFEGLELWTDGGDFSDSADDVYVGDLNWDGSGYEITGLTQALPVGGHDFVLVATIDAGATLGATIELSIPTNGITVASSNDGPVVGTIDAPRVLTIRDPVNTVTATAQNQSGVDLLPGDSSIPLFELELANAGAAPETLLTFTVTNTSEGLGSATELDDSFTPLSIQTQVLGDFEEIESGSWASGAFTSSVPIVVPPGSSQTIRIVGGASLTARDGDSLDVAIGALEDLTFNRVVDLQGVAPLDPTGAFPVNGMSVAQIAVRSTNPDLLLGASRELVFDATLPRNGYEDDVLRVLSMRNRGTALPGSDLEAVEAWLDLDSDGVFEPDTDDAAGLLGELIYTGAVWQLTGLSLPITGVGLRFFVSCDISESATEGATVQFTLPASPDFVGVAVDSDNDGPRDGDAFDPTVHPIAADDRWVLRALPLSSSTASPGAFRVPLLKIEAQNLYDDSRSLDELEVRSRFVGAGSPNEMDRQLSLLSLVEDTDDSGHVTAADSILATAVLESGEARFANFSWSLASDAVGTLFVTGDVSLVDAKDGDVLDLDVESAASLGFGEAATISATFPLDSEGEVTVDGLVASQVVVVPTPGATIGDGEGPVLALALDLPQNGYSPDVLESIRFVDQASVEPADLSELRLWRDGGDGLFDGGLNDDVTLGPLSWLGNSWNSAALSELVAGSIRVFVSATAAASLSDSARVRLALPVDGVQFASGNDGPMDAGLTSPNEILLSDLALLSSISFDKPKSVLGQTVTMRMSVRNTGTVAINSVAPSALTTTGPGSLTLVSGPTPASVNIAAQSQQEFVWTFTSDTTGSTEIQAFVSGTEQGSGLGRQSYSTSSGVHEIFAEASEVDLFPIATTQPSISQGQTSVVPLSLTFTNDSVDGPSEVSVQKIVLRLEDENGDPVIPSDLLSRIAVNEGTQVYREKTTLETSGDLIDLTLSQPISIASDGITPGIATIAFTLDIAPSTLVPTFRLVLDDASAIQAEDATSLAPVSLALEPGVSFPITSGLARVVAEATRLVVSEGTPQGAQDVGQGQTNVSAVSLSFLNPGTIGLGADARVGSFDVELIDDTGSPVAQAASVLSRVRVRSSVTTYLDRPVSLVESGTLTLVLPQLLSVPVATPSEVWIEVDVSASATLGTFRVQLGDSASFDVRDGNTGDSLPVSIPALVTGSPLQVEAPAEEIEISHTPGLAGIVPLGATDVTVVTMFVGHPGSSGTGAVQLESLTFRCVDEAGGGVTPSSMLDRVRVLVDSSEVFALADLPSFGNEFTVFCSTTIAPGDTREVQLLADFELTAPSGLFQMVLPATGFDARDENLATPVGATAAPGSELPVVSGVAQILAAARELEVSFEPTLPPVLAQDGSFFPVLSAVLSNTADPTADRIFVESIELEATDATGTTVAIGAALEIVRIHEPSVSRRSNVSLSPSDDTALVTFTPPLEIFPGIDRELVLEASLRTGGSAPHFRVGLASDAVGVVQPANPLLTVAVVASEGSTFPFWTESASVSRATLVESYSNFPNPFAAGRENTTFAFFLRDSGRVTLKLWSARGTLVRTLLDNEPLASGLHQSTLWDGRNGQGETVLNGVYVADVTVTYDDGSSERELRKVAVVR